MKAAASYGDDSPMAAFACAPGRGAITLIRCSGKGAPELAAGIFSGGERLARAKGHTLLHGWIVSESGEKIDEVLVSVFRAPRSYTGEDGIEVSCHGGNAAGNGVMAALRSAGFRDALPGEFTFRAFLNGKLDLTRCESVMELVSAETDMARRGAVSRLSGTLEAEINSIKGDLVEVLSGAEILLDYGEDEIGPDGGRLSGLDLAEDSLARLKRLADSWRRERIYREGILAVIAGRPNAGKSSLFNLLLREDRSIVAEVPGTTRDWIEASVSIGGIPVRLVDTAGLRSSADPVEAIGVERSRGLLEAADLILYLVDGERGISGEDADLVSGFSAAGKKPVIAIWNKTDVAPMPAVRDGPFAGMLGASAKTGEGAAELSAAVAGAVLASAGETGGRTETASVGTARQKDLVEAAADSVAEALKLARADEPLDLIAPLLREAVNLLGEITGEVSTADILGEMFGRFCVGK